MQRKKFTDEIRAAVETCGVSRYRLWKETGVDAGTLCRLMQGGFLSAEGLDALAEFLDLHVVVGGKSGGTTTKSLRKGG